MEGTKTKQNKKTKPNQPTKKISQHSFTFLFQKEYSTFLSYKFAQIEHILFNILNTFCSYIEQNIFCSYIEHLKVLFKKKTPYTFFFFL